MTKEKYIYQKYLLSCAYDAVCLETLEKENLHDEAIRTYVSLQDLDVNTDRQDDFEDFVSTLKKENVLVLCDDRPHTQNNIIKQYEEATLKSYICRLQDAGFRCIVKR